jgi:methionyl-tRNA formyltransferase
MLLQEPVSITKTTTAETLHDALAALGAMLITQALEGLATGRLKPTPQPADGVTYAKKLEREDGLLDWFAPAEVLARQVRALTPWPGAYFDYNGTRIKVLAAEASLPTARKLPGMVLDDKLLIACGEGALRLLRLQREGRAAMEAEAFLRGFPLPLGTLIAPATKEF